MLRLIGRESEMSSAVIGLGCLLFFAVSQGVRDAFFGNVFQSVSFLAVAVLAFGASTLVFTGIAAYRDRGKLHFLLKSKRDFFALNLTNAGAWLSFFFALRHLEPAVVATLYNGIGPLAVLALQASGWLRCEGRSSSGELACYGGIALALTALVTVVLTNRSGLALSDLAAQGSAIAAALIGGVMITASHVFARRFSDKGVGSDAILGTRSLLTLIAAAILELTIGTSSARPSLEDVPHLTMFAFALVVLPSFALQLGIARASPLAVNVFRGLGPVSVFLVQQFDGRLRFSGATLGCVIVFSSCAILASVLRGWSEAKGNTSSQL